MTSKNKTCIIVCGPTAVGKTGVALQLAKEFNTKIISADSRQCFRELNIGVAKPSDEELNSVPHFFINSHSIFDELNVADFERYADAAANEIFASANVAIMAGGTGLYINAFCNGLDDISGLDLELRKTIRQEYKENGIDWLRSAIEAADPDFAASDDLANPQRMMRALEVIGSTGKSIRSFQTKPQKSHDFDIVKIGLELPREILYKRIDDRVDEMIENGLVEEVAQLIEFKNFNALNTVGYKEIFDFLEGDLSLDESINRIKQSTRHYAKRQLTWFKKDTRIQWFSPYDTVKIMTYCRLPESD